MYSAVAQTLLITRQDFSAKRGVPTMEVITMDASLSDGDFKVETKSVNVPNIDVGTLFEKD